MKDFPIIRKLGGRKAIMARLVGIDGRPLKPSTIRMWVVRCRIPGHFQNCMKEWAEQEGIPFGYADFKPADVKKLEPAPIVADAAAVSEPETAAPERCE
jgi:hypothetical protein